MISESDITINGEIIFDSLPKQFSSAAVDIQLRNIEKQDASAEIKARKILNDVKFKDVKNNRLAFSLNISVSTLKSGFNVIWAHVDLDGDREISKDDFITTEIYPVSENPVKVIEVIVKKI